MPTAPQSAAAPTPAVAIYGAAWCEDTRRARRLLRRLDVAHRYVDVDEDLEALREVTAMSDGVPRTPVVSIDGLVLIEPSNEALCAGLVERGILTWTQIDDRLSVRNVGDVDRGLRVVAGLTLTAATKHAPPAARGMLRLLSGWLLVSGVAGWCPVYRAAHVSSLNGPGDRPDEAERSAWLKAMSAPPVPQPPQEDDHGGPRREAGTAPPGGVATAD